MWYSFAHYLTGEIMDHRTVAKQENKRQGGGTNLNFCCGNKVWVPQMSFTFPCFYKMLVTFLARKHFKFLFFFNIGRQDYIEVETV